MLMFEQGHESICRKHLLFLSHFPKLAALAKKTLRTALVSHLLYHFMSCFQQFVYRKIALNSQQQSLFEVLIKRCNRVQFFRARRKIENPDVFTFYFILHLLCFVEAVIIHYKSVIFGNFDDFCEKLNKLDTRQFFRF